MARSLDIDRKRNIGIGKSDLSKVISVMKLLRNYPEAVVKIITLKILFCNIISG